MNVLRASCSAAFVLTLLAGVPANAQEAAIDPWIGNVADGQSLGRDNAGQLADTGAGELGQRQTAQDAGINAAPAGRVESRIYNRIQNRVRTRIDRHQSSSGDARSSYDAALERSRRGLEPQR